MELFRNSGFSRVRVPRCGAFHSGLVRALSSAVSAASAFLSAWPALCQARSAPRAPSSRLGPRSVKRGQRRERNFRSSFAFSRAQARSAPRAHVRGLLCVSQSSKERLRCSRTESSGAAPAIEELPGDARQCKARRAACGSVSSRFCFLTGGEVWRESGPPAPPGIKFLRKFNIPPLPRLRPAEVGKFRPGIAFSHRRGLEGVRPSSSPEHQILAEVQHSTSASTAPCRSRKIPPRHRFLPSKRSGGSQALQLPWHQILADIRIPVRLPLFFLKTNRLEEEPPFA